jgi:hypothetical protein
MMVSPCHALPSRSSGRGVGGQDGSALSIVPAGGHGLRCYEHEFCSQVMVSYTGGLLSIEIDITYTPFPG